MPELRKDPITARWVIISTERGRRPMDFVRESVVVTGPRGCPFCPGAENKTPPEILAYGRNGGGALFVSQMLSGLLYGVSTVDPISFLGPPLALTMVSLIACYVPALRASRIDPIKTLRAE